MKRSAVICNKQTLYPCSGNTMFMPSDPLLLPTSQVGYVDLHVWYIWNRQFNRKGNLNRHLNFHTVLLNELKNFGTRCDMNHALYLSSNSSSFISHLATDSFHQLGTSIFTCHICSRSFNQKGNLTRHLKFHTGVRPFVCHVCSRGFSLKQHLIRHVRVHSAL